MHPFLRLHYSAQGAVPEPGWPVLREPRLRDCLLSSDDVRVMTETLSGTGASDVPNHYQTLNIQSQLTTKEIREMLEVWRLNWAARATRAGTRGDEARAMLAKVDSALTAFESDASREAYDLSLRRAPQQVADAEQRTDWLGIAWNYYYTRDLGAAGVAARKAREQNSKDPMPFVVSAWVELGEGELRRAKDYADEAYVLDELGTDTADVHAVRGAVFHHSRDFERAVQHFDRALAKAVEGERSEIQFFKALSLEGLRRHDDMLDTLVAGLTVDVPIPHGVRTRLEQATRRAIVHTSDDHGNPGRAVSAYDAKRRRIAESRISEPSKTQLLAWVDGRLKDWRRKADLVAIATPSGAIPGVPLGTAVAGILLFITGASGRWAVVLLIGLALIAWAAYRIYSRTEWNRAKGAFDSAQAELIKVTERLNSGATGLWGASSGERVLQTNAATNVS